MELMSWAIVMVVSAGREPVTVDQTFRTQAECMERLEQVKSAVWNHQGKPPEIACYLKVEPAKS